MIASVDWGKSGQGQGVLGFEVWGPSAGFVQLLLLSAWHPHPETAPPLGYVLPRGTQHGAQGPRAPQCAAQVT